MPEAIKKTLFTVLRLLLIALGVFIMLKIGGYLVPFILAFIFASMIEPLVKFIETKLKISRKIGSVFSILVVLGVILTFLGFIISRLVKEIINFSSSLNITADNISNFINNIIEKANDFFIGLPIEIADGINSMLTDITSKLGDLLKPIVDLATGIATGTIQFAFTLPQVLIFIFVTIMATYFMSSDKNVIMYFLDAQIPSEWIKKVRAITHNVFIALFGWLKAQLILMLITFSEVLAGLLIIGIQNSLLIAIMIAVVDALPVLGAGTVLLPWAIINLLSGQTRMGLSLLLLYIIIIFVRQLIEPKIVGKQIGIHPLFTLFGMYLGLQFIGVLGMFLGPLCVVVIKYLLEGIFKVEGFKGWYERNFKVKSKATTPGEEDSDDNTGPPSANEILVDDPGPPPVEH
jgi:sporulation integral membrane protein YtvI